MCTPTFSEEMSVLLPASLVAMKKEEKDCCPQIEENLCPKSLTMAT